MSSGSDASEQPTSTRRTSSKKEQRRAALDRLKQTKSSSSSGRVQPTFLGADDDDDDDGSGGINMFDGLAAVNKAVERMNKKRPSTSPSQAEEPRRGRDPFLDNAFDDLFDLGDAAPNPSGAAGDDISGAAAAEDLDVDGGATKKRKVVAKLDETRLLGPMGFPKLRQALRKVKIKGKGHELQDLRRVLTLYQLWTHELFPRTNLRDTLTTVEKLCHKRSVQRELKTYRDLEKTGKLAQDDASLTAADDLFGDLAPFGSGSGSGSGSAAAAAKDKGKEQVPAEKAFEEDGGDDGDGFGFDADEEEAILAELEREATQAQASAADAKQPPPPPAKEKPRTVFEEDEDMFGAEEDILAELEREEREKEAAKARGKEGEKEKKRMSFEAEDEFGFGDDVGAEEDVLRELEAQEREAAASAAAAKAKEKAAPKEKQRGGGGEEGSPDDDEMFAAEEELLAELEKEAVAGQKAVAKPAEKVFEVSVEDEEAEAALREAEELLGF